MSKQITYGLMVNLEVHKAIQKAAKKFKQSPVTFIKKCIKVGLVFADIEDDPTVQIIIVDEKTKTSRTVKWGD